MTRYVIDIMRLPLAISLVMASASAPSHRQATALEAGNVYFHMRALRTSRNLRDKRRPGIID